MGLLCEMKATLQATEEVGPKGVEPLTSRL